MEILILLILFSIAVAGSFLGAFLWAMKSGQFEDTFTPSVRILFDSERSVVEKQTKTTQK